MVLCDFGARSGQQLAGIQAGRECELGALVFLEGLVQDVVAISQSIETPNLPSIPPFFAFPINQAIKILEFNLKDGDAVDKKRNIETLKHSLEIGNGRWRAAGIILPSSTS